MRRHFCNAPFTVFSMLTVLTVLSISVPSSATGNILKSDLTGTWNIVMHGNTGCGLVAMTANTTLDTTGRGTGTTLTTHGQCGDSIVTGQTFLVQTLASNGSGTANLSCGTGCGWNFTIQVSPDRDKITLVDISSKNPGNYVEGIAVRNSRDNDTSLPDLAGNWQVTLYGATGCGVTDMLVTFTLNSSGVATNADSLGHSAGCGDGTGTNDSFTIQTLNPDGSGTANLTCGAGCGWNFVFQLSPDRSTFDLADVSSANPGNYLAGEAIRASASSNVSIANLAGAWELSIIDSTGCNFGSLQVTFSLSTTGVTSAATEKGHTAGCGDGTTTGNTFTITSLNANGSGTANLTCGPSCGWNLNIQVSPDRSAFNLVDVSSANPGNFMSGQAIHR